MNAAIYLLLAVLLIIVGAMGALGAVGIIFLRRVLKRMDDIDLSLKNIKVEIVE